MPFTYLWVNQEIKTHENYPNTAPDYDSQTVAKILLYT